MAVELENELSFKDYVSMVKRRWVPMLLVVIAGLIIALIVALNVQPIYRAQGLISIESPTISKELIGGNIGQLTAAKYVDEQVDKVKQKVLSRENLQVINEKYQLFPGVTKPSELAGKLGKSIEFLTETRSTDGTAWAQKVTVGFSIVFEHADPEKTYNVVNDVIKQVLDQNEKDRTLRATETTQFLTGELNRLKAELEVVEDEVADFKQKNADSLPEHQDMHMKSLDQLRNDMQSLDIEYKGTQEELRYLDVELSTANANLNKPQGGLLGQKVAISELDKAKNELNNALVAYKETHPTVKALRRKVALLEKEEQNAVNEVQVKAPSNPNAELAIAKINSQIEAAKVRLKSISQQKTNLRAQIARINRQVVKIPQVERELVKLLRDYENAKTKYEEVKAKQVNAKIAEDLEKDNKSERFVLVQSPEFPEYRINLSKTKMMIFGFLGSIGAGLGLGLLLEALDKRVRGLARLTSIINAKPIAVIPYIDTHAEQAKSQWWRKFIIALLVLIVVVALALLAIHFFVTPLGDLILEFKESIKSM